MVQRRQGVRHQAGGCTALGCWQHRLDRQETWGTLAVYTCTKVGWGFLKTLCKKSWWIAQSEQKPDKNNDRVAKRTQSLKRTFIVTKAGKQSWVWQMHAGIWNSLTRSLCLWGFSHIKTQAPRIFILWNQVTMRTSLSAGHCTSFNVYRPLHCPLFRILFYSILFYSILFYSNLYHPRQPYAGL